jgi:two-component system sensor histidine kinase BarA
LRAACQRSETLLKQDDPKAAAALDELERSINRLAAQARISA